MPYPEIYYKTLTAAMGDGEIAAFRASRRADQDACRDLERSLKTYSDGGAYTGGEWEGKIMEAYGPERLSYILATTVLDADDGVYPKDLVDWAGTVRLSEDGDVRAENALSSEPSLVSEFISRNIPRFEEVADNEDRAEESGERISVPSSSYVRRYQTYTAFSMPNIGGYDGYIYYIPNTAVRDDGEYRSFTLAPETEVNVQKGGSKRNLAFEQLSHILSNASVDDYPKAETVEFEFSARSVMQRRGDAYRLSIGKGRSCYVDASFLTDEGDVFLAKIPKGYSINVYGRGDREAPLSAQELKDKLQIKVENVYTSDSHAAFEIPPAQIETEYSTRVLFRLPEGAPHAGYTYYIDSSMLMKDSDSGMYTASMKAADMITLTNRETGETASISASDLAGEVSARAKRAAVEFDIPAAALAEARDSSYRFVLPGNAEAVAVVDKTYVSETEKGYRVTMPDDKKIIVSGRAVAPTDLREVFSSAQASDFSTSSAAPGNATVALPLNALVAENEKRMFFRMPDGKMGRCAYWYPASLVKKGDEAITLTVPDDILLHITGDPEGPMDITAKTFVDAVSGKTASDYRGEFVRPTQGLQGFMSEERERALRANVPEEMKQKKNWVMVQCPYNYERGKRDKFLVNCNNGHFAKSNDPATWTDFESAIRYAKSHGGDTLAYALDGRDGIVCLDADHSVDIYGNDSDKVKALRRAAPEDIYCERSVSGDGYHFFGKSAVKDLPSWSQDGELEIYIKDHFISMTGDCEAGKNVLASLDSEEARFFINNNFAKRVAFNNAGKGHAGLSSLSDQAVVERAKEANGGDMFTRLYNGEDVKRDPSRSDYALMSRLAFWCNGDKDQMIRIFCSSGLYRPEKSDEYYEHTAMKAVENSSSFYDPKKHMSDKKKEGNRDGNKKA